MLPHELCSRLSNASASRHRWVPFTPTKQHLSLLSLLLSQGFITSLSLGSTSTTSSSSPTNNNNNNNNTPPDPKTFNSTRISQKRIWVELKYRQERPVLNKMELVSKPSRKVILDKEELSRFVRGSRVKFVRGLGMGEVGLVKSGKENWVEAREAVRKGLGGEVVARVG